MALAKTALGGMLGLEVSLAALPGRLTRDDRALFAESQGRILVTIAPGNQEIYEKKMGDLPFARIGTVTDDGRITVRGLGGDLVIGTDVGSTLRSYRSTFEDY